MVAMVSSTWDTVLTSPTGTCNLVVLTVNSYPGCGVHNCCRVNTFHNFKMPVT